ncbi:MAG: patatin family protein [Erysipelotrichaceae bacterium]|nr:patatin family protein [Erysipelotrichaceae bacterium]
MKTGLIMEGGAMRGLFTCGVIDVLMENDITFDGGAGISAGAVFGCNFKSRQHGRPLRYNLNYCKDPRYGSFVSVLKTGDLFDADFCYREVPEVLDPFDAKAFGENPMEFYVGATNIESGICEYHLCSDGLKEDTLWMRASASMPLVSKPVKINGHYYLDGGVVDSIPYHYMKTLGYDRNLVVLTQPEGFVKKKANAAALIKVVMRKYPELGKAMEVRHERYNEQLKEVEEDEKKGFALIIRPPESLKIGRTEKDRRELERVYQIGRKVSEERLEDIRSFLKG